MYKKIPVLVPPMCGWMEERVPPMEPLLIEEEVGIIRSQAEWKEYSSLYIFIKFKFFLEVSGVKQMKLPT